jgi:hypothetical protein
MRVKDWDYRELGERIADGIMLRTFTNFYCEEVPNMTPSTAAICSIFEPHTDLIKRGKVH